VAEQEAEYAHDVEKHPPPIGQRASFRDADGIPPLVLPLFPAGCQSTRIVSRIPIDPDREEESMPNRGLRADLLQRNR
jgi:hypothetical protein